MSRTFIPTRKASCGLVLIKGFSRTKNNQFNLILHQSDSSESKARSNNVNRITTGANGNIVFTTTKGSFEVKDNLIVEKDYLPKEATYGIHLDGESLIIGGIGRLFIISKDKSKVVELTKDYSQLKLEKFESHHARVWIGTAEGLFVIEDLQVKKFTDDPVLAQTPITSILEDSDRTLWVATNSGLFRLKDDSVFEYIANSHPKSFKVLLSMYEDNEKNIWLGSYVHGIAKLSKAFADNFGVESGLKEPIVWSIQPTHSGELYVGTNNGLEYFSDGEYKSILKGFELPHPVVYTQLLTPEGLIVGTRAGAFIYHNNKIRIPEAFLCHELQSSARNFATRKRTLFIYHR